MRANRGCRKESANYFYISRKFAKNVFHKDELKAQNFVVITLTCLCLMSIISC